MVQDELPDSTREQPEIDEVLLQTLIFQKLDEIRSGDLYVEHGLGHDSIHKLLHDAAVYKKFESIIGKTWMDIDQVQREEKGLSSGGKMGRKKKSYVNALKDAKEFLRDQIGAYIELISSKRSDLPTEVQNDGTHDSASMSDEEDTVSSLSDGKISRSSSSHSRKKKRHKKKKKRKDKKKQKKRKRRLSHEDSSEENSYTTDNDSLPRSRLTEEEKKKRIEIAKSLFEKEKQEILNRIPDDVKKDFRSLCFTKWSTHYLPVIQLGPFDVRPGAVRDQWMEMFQNVSKKKRPLTRLVFWYGSPKNDLSEAYTFTPKHKLISYEEGCKKDYHKVPARIAKKMKEGKKLTASESRLVDGLEEIAIDAKLDPADRSPWLFDFEEDYDLELSDIEEEESVKSHKKKITKKQKIKGKNTAKKEDEKVSKRRKRKSGEGEIEKKQRKKTKTLEEEIQEEVAEEDAMMEFEVSSKSEQDDDDFSQSVSDEEEELYEEEVVGEKSRKKKDKLSTEQDRKTKEILKTPEEIEQECFEVCEKTFLPLMRKLHNAQTETEAKKFVKKIEKDVKLLTPAFIRAHKIGITVKKVREAFNTSDDLNQLCKQLTSKMKKVFHEKLATEPEGFQPILTKKTIQLSQKKQKLVDAGAKKSSKIGSPITEKKDVPIAQGSAPNSVHEGLTNEEISDSIEAPAKVTTKSEKAVKSKPARKSFSLAGMIERKPTPTPLAESSVQTGGNEATSPIPVKVEQPEWTINFKRVGRASELNSSRKFAMEFLMDAVSCLPKGTVDPTSIAHAIEDALYEKYGEGEHYMEHLHDICAAIAGKMQMGSLAQKIIAGSYATPVDVINIPRKMLFQSFEGTWVP